MKNIRIQQGCLAVAGIAAAGSLLYTVLSHNRRTKTCKTLEEATKDLADPVDENNDILCREIRVARDYNKNHLLNQTLVVGGPGSGKSFAYVGPNLMQMNASYIVNDPDGQYMKEYGALLAYHGYEIMCLNMADPDKSNHYNPFRHIQTARDICILADALCPDCAGRFDRSEIILVSALIAYLHNYAEESMRNLSGLAQILREAQKESYQESLSDSYLDNLFAKIAEKDPNGFAVREYKDFKIAAGSTARTAIAKAYARLMVFEEPKARMLTDTDDLDFDAFGSKKTALFVIPDEGSLSCLSSVCYSQLIEHFDCATESYEATHLSVILDADRHVIKTFYADNDADVVAVAENYFERAKQGTIHFCENRNRWELLMPDGEIVLWRGTEEAAQAAFNALKRGTVMQGKEFLKDGLRLPVPVRFLLDGFENIGRIPRLPSVLSYMHYYGISFSLIMQSVYALKTIYKYEWQELFSSIGITICCGDYPDYETKSLFSWYKMNVQGTCEIKPDTCIVYVYPYGAIAGHMYRANEHPLWALKESLGEYRFIL